MNIFYYKYISLHSRIYQGAAHRLHDITLKMAGESVLLFKVMAVLTSRGGPPTTQNVRMFWKEGGDRENVSMRVYILCVNGSLQQKKVLVRRPSFTM